MNSRAPLTEVQQFMYNFIVSFIRENRYSPTIREIQTHFGYSSSNSVVSQLNKMEKKGYITKSSSKDGMKARTIRLVDDLMGMHTVESKQLNKALKGLLERGYKLDLNVAVELLGALEINVI